MRGEPGIALVQVMVMSLVLLLMATGVMQIIFGTHYMYARVKNSEENKGWIEACMAQKNQSWQGDPCAGKASDSCDFSAEKGPTVDIACKAAAKSADGKEVTFKVTWQ